MEWGLGGSWTGKKNAMGHILFPLGLHEIDSFGFWLWMSQERS